MAEKVIVVGAGLGGLSTALRLVKKGYEVEIIEKNSKAGGRLNQIKKDGFTFDTGPSFFSMSYEFKQFAQECNIEIPFKYIELDPLYSVNFSGSPKTYHLYKDSSKLADQFLEEEPSFKEKFDNYLRKSGKIFNDTVDIVIKNNFDSKLAYFLTLAQVNPTHVPVLFRSFWQQVKRHFNSKEARQIISLVAFFLGRTPFDTMAIYTLLSYTEFKHDGYFNVEGGMYGIVEGILSELEKERVKITYNTEIVAYESENGKIKSVIDESGHKYASDIFLINADAAVFRSTVLKRKKYSPEKLSKMNWTMGYLTFYVGVGNKLPHVNHHNYFLGTNYEEYANKVLNNADTLQKPYYYVNVISKYNPDCAPEGCEALFFVCPVPNLMYKTDWSDKEIIVQSIIDDFSKRIGTDITGDIISQTIYTPQDWQDQFNLYKGSGLGLSHSMWQIGAFRPANFDEKFENVFYVGASTIPGAGLPMAIISSK
ncbi:MAG: phytoene desaturase, partial [Candidatus Cloacimonetes bacterium]|nr:phytoene desaturase [Candidatus Cloacimonadota bacterium]